MDRIDAAYRRVAYSTGWFTRFGGAMCGQDRAACADRPKLIPLQFLYVLVSGSILAVYCPRRRTIFSDLILFEAFQATLKVSCQVSIVIERSDSK
jgi:hypothetical protein